jgi:hypothetical protein
VHPDRSESLDHVDTFSCDCSNNLRIKFLVQRKGPEGLTEAYPERPSKEAGKEA